MLLDLQKEREIFRLHHEVENPFPANVNVTRLHVLSNAV
jgi:hypothetical protein